MKDAKVSLSLFISNNAVLHLPFMYLSDLVTIFCQHRFDGHLKIAAGKIEVCRFIVHFISAAATLFLKNLQRIQRTIQSFSSV